MQRGLDALNRQDGGQAQQQGERAAEQLEQLSAHLAAMNARDFGERLSQAQQLAQDLALREASLEQQLAGRSGRQDSSAAAGGRPTQQPSPQSSHPGASAAASSAQGQSTDGQAQPAEQRQASSSRRAPSDPQSQAEEQAALAARTDMLAELLDALRRDAVGKSSGVRSQLDEIEAGNPPAAIADDMRQTAEHLQQRNLSRAAQGATHAREQLDELSRSLGAAHRDHATPQLEELIALEERLAHLIQQLRRAPGDDARGSAADERWQQLEPRLDSLAAGDRRLADALQRLREGHDDVGRTSSPSNSAEQTSPSTTGAQPNRNDNPSAGAPAPYRNGQRREPREGVYTPDQIRHVSGYNEISRVLQMKIQEAILAGALLDSDQPVPPEYRRLVDEYYRTLSDDLR
jgi:hypothetical protein